MDARIRMLLTLIDERGGVLPMTSREIGDLLGLGEARTLRLFSREVGKTLRQYLLEVRMARAARLLDNLGLPIKAIAFDCGYNLAGNFCRDFKRVHGISPMQMRHQHMNSQICSLPLTAFAP